MPLILRWLLRLGPTNPIAVRLVQGGSRRRRHFYIRATYLGVLIAVLLYTLLLNASGELEHRQLAAAGAKAFTFVAYLQIGLICVLAPVFMAGAIAQEASPRTWDILLTTPMSASEVVLGNLIGRLFFIIALLVSSLPLFAVTQYFGGVPSTSIFASYLIAICAATLVAAAAVALSVSRLVGKRAVFAFYVSVISYLAVTAGIDAVMSKGGVTVMTSLNPFLALTALLNPTGYPSESATLHSGLSRLMLVTPAKGFCVLSLTLSVVLVLASVVTVRAGGLSTFASSGSGVPWYRRMFGLGAKGAEHRAPRHVWSNPVIWREAAARNATLGRMAARWSFVAVGGLFGLGVVLYFHGGSMTSGTFRTTVLYTVIGELAVISLVAINMGATSVTREREDGTLDLMLTTPITASAYLAGKMSGMVAYLLPMLAVPIGTLAAAGIYVGGAQAGLWTRTGATGAGGGVVESVTVPGTSITHEVPLVLPESLIVAAAVAIPFVAFCVMVGLQWSLKSKGSLSSVVATVGVVGVIAGVVGLCAWTAAGSVAFVGPALAGLSPATAVYACVDMKNALRETVMGDGGPGTARFSLLVGSFIAIAVYAAVVYGIHANMVRTFDFTVRKLAGTK